MTLPTILAELLRLLLDLAAPGALCSMTLAGLALRHDGGVNFEAGGRFQRWMIWSVLFLTLPQFLSWFAAIGISMPPEAPQAAATWLTGMESAFSNFVSGIVIARLVPVFAAFLVLKAALDFSQGASPLSSGVPALFLLCVSGSLQLMRGWNSGTEFATADMLVSIWNYLAGTILPEAAGLAVVAAVLNYSRKRPFLPQVLSALAFLSVTALWKLANAMVL